MLDYCVECGNKLKEDCPKPSSQCPCQECVNEQGERECRRRSTGRNVCLCCNRRYMNNLYPIVKQHRKAKAADQIKPLFCGPLILEDISGDIVVHWEPRTKGEEAYHIVGTEVKELHEWVGMALARRPEKGRYSIYRAGERNMHRNS